MSSSNSKTATIRTVCGLPDYMRCGLSVEVSDGTITGIRPADFPDPVDKGACPKGLAAAQLVCHPARLRHPLKRVGERGAGQWQRISWQEALDGIATKLQEVAGRYGPSSVAWATPVMPNLTGGGYSRLISLTGGRWVDWWGCGDAAGPCADMATFGTMMGEAYLNRIEDPRFTIVWGYNPALTVSYYMRRISRARRKGCRLVVIDPRYTETAARADEHIAIRPGTDGALALGMIHVVLDRGLQDEQFIAGSTVGPLLVRSDNGLFLRQSDLFDGGSQQAYVVYDGAAGQPRTFDGAAVAPALTGTYSVSGVECRPAFQLLAGVAAGYPPERVAEITGVPVDVIRRLAISYATEKPASIYRGWGVQRSFYGDLNSRAINALAAITGNVNLKRPSTFVLNSRPFMMPAGPYNSIPLLSLHEAVAGEDTAPVKAVWCAGHNPVNQMPNKNRIVGELLPRLELLVVCDLFMTATAGYADYVLPAASFLECTDVCMAGFENTWLQYQQKVVDPVGESKPDFQIAAELGRRMGFGEYFDKTEEEYIEELLASGHPTMEGVSLERLKQGPVMARDMDRPQQLRTLTGRIEFYVETLKQFGQELPVHMEPVENDRCDKARVYPLAMLSSHPADRIHSTMAIASGPQGQALEPFLEINPADAAKRGISDGDLVRAFNDRGQVKVKAKVSQRMRPGVVDVTEGWWPEQYVEGHHNELTHDIINPAQKEIFQANAAFFDVLVEVEKVKA